MRFGSKAPEENGSRCEFKEPLVTEPESQQGVTVPKRTRFTAAALPAEALQSQNRVAKSSGTELS